MNDDENKKKARFSQTQFIQMRLTNRCYFEKILVESSGDLKPMFRSLISLRLKQDKENLQTVAAEVKIYYKIVAALPVSKRSKCSKLLPSDIDKTNKTAAKSLYSEDRSNEDASSCFSELLERSSSRAQRLDSCLPDIEDFDHEVQF